MGTSVAGYPVSSVLTTPEAPDLHALFAVMVEHGVDVCAMEVSSHALEVGRVDGVVFDLAVFTNFGRDHLDFHETVEAYFAAKSGLFTASRARRGLINVDDPTVVRLLEEPSIELTTFSASGADADWRATAVATSGAGSRMTISGPGVQIAGSVALPGAFNVSNVLCAVAAIGEVGLDISGAAEAISALDNVPGRMERIDRGQGFLVIVDYAHKPDAITAALEALRPVTTGRLIIVLGAGGNRDIGKRPLMGQVAASLADVVIVTDDNPRAEDPRLIRSQVIAGAATIVGGANVREIGDRELAIATAMHEAAAGDTVVVAGKGHETGQEIAGSIYPFDDRDVVTAVLEQLTAAGGRN
jgi:UDP-N-acetylmuramoyl-L-alanyl-D-glutamate--2,6-diaminopimelate ligase